MTQQIWAVYRNSVDITTEVMSMDYSTGRKTQFDSWSPGSLVFTIRNDAGQADAYSLNDDIVIEAVGYFDQRLYLQEILYNDSPGTGANSTATIVCTDLLGRLGRTQVFEEYLASTNTLQQIDDYFGFLMPLGTSIILNGSGDSIAEAETYTGTALNRLNLNMTTEQGWLAVTDIGIYLYARSNVDDLAPGQIVFAREISGVYQLAYSDIQRIALGSNYLNTCTVTAPLVAAQNVSDTDGITAYGYYGAEIASVDNTANQANGLASWQVYSRSNPAELSFQISVNDLVNDLGTLFTEIYVNQPVVTVGYQQPGSSVNYVSSQIMQGWSMTVTPEATYMEIFTSPLSYTNFFTLNSATFGRLGGTGVTYNSEIFYNESDYTYNDTFADDAGRLGW